MLLFDLPYDYLSGIEWTDKDNPNDYRFPMPTTISFHFQIQKVDHLIQEVKEAPSV